MASGASGPWSEWPVDHFLRAGRIAARDGAAVRWFHAANSRARAARAARSDVHMVEVDVVLRGGDGDPVLAHPPDTDSDITLQEWLALMASTNKGIKLDFKRYSLTVWTGKEDVYSVEDLLLIRENFDKSRVYYDIFEPQNSEFKKAIGIE